MNKKVLTNGFLINGSGEHPFPDTALTITGEFIESIRPTTEISDTSDIEIIDLGGRTILPGLIDLHTHCTWQYYFHSETARTSKPPLSDTMIALRAIPRLQEALHAGLTTVRDLGAVGSTIFELRDAIERGWIQGPRLCIAGKMIEPTGGAHPGSTISVTADGKDNIRTEVRRQIAAGVDVIKIGIDRREWTQAEINAAVDEAHRHELKVACHVLHPASTKLAIAAGVDSLEHARFIDEEDAALMAERNIAWVAVVSGVRDKIPLGEEYLLKPGIPAKLRKEIEATLALSREVVSVQPETFKRALDAGLTIGAGTDRTGAYGRDPFADLARELEVMHQLGLSPMQAIQSATGLAAEIMGWEDRLGQISPGLLADIVVVDGNPLEDIGCLRQVAMVIKGGEIIIDKRASDKYG